MFNSKINRQLGSLARRLDRLEYDKNQRECNHYPVIGGTCVFCTKCDKVLHDGLIDDCVDYMINYFNKMKEGFKEIKHE